MAYPIEEYDGIELKPCVRYTIEDVVEEECTTSVAEAEEIIAREGGLLLYDVALHSVKGGARTLIDTPDLDTARLIAKALLADNPCLQRYGIMDLCGE